MPEQPPADRPPAEEPDSDLTAHAAGEGHEDDGGTAPANGVSTGDEPSTDADATAAQDDSPTGAEPVTGEEPAPVPSPPAGRERLLAALRSGPNRAQVVVAVLLALVGYAATTQVRSTQTDDYSNLRQSDLIRIFDGLSGSTQRAEDEISRLESVREDLRTSSSRRQAALTQARDDAETLRILAGTVPTRGPGVRFTVTDDSGEISDNTLLDIIQELRSAGAEALEFNDRVRVVAQTYVEETSEGISVGGEVLSPPYVIDAIGEPSTLAGSLDFVTGPIDQVEDEGGTLTVEQVDDVLIESVVDDADLRVAEPDPDE